MRELAEMRELRAKVVEYEKKMEDAMERMERAKEEVKAKWKGVG